MAGNKPKTKEKPLTDVELEMMNVIWKIGPCTVAQMLEMLPPERDLAYTSVSTIVRILEQKKFVKSRKEGRGHLYSAAVEKDEYQQVTIGHVVKNVFDNAPAELVRQLLDSRSLSAKDIAAIKSMLQQKV